MERAGKNNLATTTTNPNASAASAPPISSSSSSNAADAAAVEPPLVFEPMNPKLKDSLAFDSACSDVSLRHASAPFLFQTSEP